MHWRLMLTRRSRPEASLTRGSSTKQRLVKESFPSPGAYPAEVPSSPDRPCLMRQAFSQLRQPMHFVRSTRTPLPSAAAPSAAARAAGQAKGRRPAAAAPPRKARRGRRGPAGSLASTGSS